MGTARPVSGRPASIAVRSLTSIADQGATAALTFAVSIVVGRVLGAEALGLFAMTSVLVMIIRQGQAAAILEPMAVFGARRQSDERGRYLGFVLAVHGIGIGGLTAAAATLTALAMAFGWIGDTAGWAILGALLFANATTLLNLLRRQFYVDEQPYRALLQSLAVLILSLASLAIAWATAGIGLFRIYALLTVAAGMVILVQWPLVGIGIALPRDEERRQFASEHRRFGSWSILTVPLTIATYHGFFVLAGSVLSVEETGLLKAADTLVAPFAQGAIGLSLMFVPIVARRLAVSPPTIRSGAPFHLIVAFSLATLAYAVVVFCFGDALIGLIFGPHLAAAGDLARLFALLPLAIAGAVPAGVMLAARGRADLRFAATGTAAGLGLLVGVPLIVRFGLTGAAIALVLTQTALAMALWAAWLYYRRQHRPRPAGRTS